MKMKPSITVSSADTMFDSRLHIKIKGLLTGQFVTLHAFTSIRNGNDFESVANYVADDKGHIDLNRDASVGGSFTGIEPMGLFWAMKPSFANPVECARFVKIDVTTPLTVTISLYDGFVTSIDEIDKLRKENSLNNSLLAVVNINRWMKAQDTQRIELTLEKDGICGTLFIPSGKGPFPGVITMFGGYTGTLEYKASLLASRGFVALALAYVGLPGLPPLDMFTELRLEYFEKATEVLLSHEKVDKKAGIGILSLSFSSFISLAMAAYLPSVKCVLWLNGFTHPMFGKIAYKNKTFQTLEFLNEDEETVPQGSTVLVKARNMFPMHIDPFCEDLDNCRIPFHERHDVGYMFIAGLSDDNVPSEHYLNQAEKMLIKSKHPNFQLLRYPGAGHLIEPCYGIHHYITQHKSFGVYMKWGGETIPHCKAQEDSWHKQIDFLKLNLTQKSRL